MPGFFMAAIQGEGAPVFSLLKAILVASPPGFSTVPGPWAGTQELARFLQAPSKSP